jgi:hypothetical protein
LTITLKPGEHQTAILTVRNLSSHAETLIPGLNSFTIDKDSEKIELSPSAPVNLRDWVKFKQQSLTIAPGASEQLDIVYDTPTNVGFSYAAAITLNPPNRNVSSQGATYKAAVAIFNLINIDRPDAKRQLTIESFSASKSLYEFLPATFNLKIRNNGNIIDQPSGNIFIQRSFNDSQPITTLSLNKGGNYILPTTSRSFTQAWEAGFPRYVTTKVDGVEKKHLSWDWHHLGDLRIGRYVAKVVMVYNDGQRDISVIASYSFWVVPWKLLLVTLAAAGLIITGVVAWARLILRGTKKVRGYAKRHHK